MPPPDSSLELSDVKDRFEASTLALDEVRRRLGALAELQEKRAGATEGLERASEHLERFTAAALEAVESLRSAQASATAAFDSMRAVVDGTDLRQVAEGIVAIEARLAESHEKQTQVLEAVVAAIDNGLTGVTSKTDEAKRAVASAESDLRQRLMRMDTVLESLSTKVEESTAARAQEFKKLADEVLLRVDERERLTKEKNELASQLAEARKQYEHLKTAVGERALRKAGLS